jgi:hypothetical protein
MAIESVILDVETARLVVYKDFKSMIEINEPLSLFEIHERMHTTKIPFSIIRARNVLFRQGILLSRFPELSCDLNCHRFGDSWKTTVWKRQNFEDIMRYKEPDKKAINQKKNRNHFHKKDNHNYKLKSYFEIKNRESCKGLLCRHCQKTSNAKSKNFYNKSSITNVLFIILPSLNSRLHISKLSFSNYSNWSCDEVNILSDISLKKRCRDCPNYRYTISKPFPKNSHHVGVSAFAIFPDSNLCFWNVTMEFPYLSELIDACIENPLTIPSFPKKTTYFARCLHHIISNSRKKRTTMYELSKKQIGSLYSPRIRELRHSRFDTSPIWFTIDPAVSITLN